MKRLFPLALAVAIVGSGTQVSAHHSTANYDYSKTVTLVGTLKKFQWTNPHSFLQIVVTDGRGKQVEWSVESGSPGLARRLGWAPEMFKVGDKLKVVLAPIRTGETKGTLKSVTLPNGKTLFGPGNQGELPNDLGLPTLKKSGQ